MIMYDIEHRGVSWIGTPDMGVGETVGFIIISDQDLDSLR